LASSSSQFDVREEFEYIFVSRKNKKIRSFCCGTFLQSHNVQCPKVVTEMGRFNSFEEINSWKKIKDFQQTVYEITNGEEFKKRF
jgi:hypothetical protein